MAKHRSHKRRSHSKSRTMRRGQQGGALAGNPPSAWGWGLGTVGNGWTQFMNSLTLQPGQNLASQGGNLSVPVGQPNAMNNQGMIGTNLKGDIPQAGGKRHRRRRSRAKRGGNVLAQAAVPGALMAGLLYANSRSKSRSRR